MSCLHPASRTRLGIAGARRAAASHTANAGAWRVRRVAARAVALAAALAAMSMARSPGDMLKADLQAAGAAVRDLGSNQPADHVQKTLAALFPGSAVDVDATQFPGRVIVTLRGIDQITCVTAATSARRIEGEVVIELRGFAAPDECGDHNDMAWLILP